MSVADETGLGPNNIVSFLTDVFERRGAEEYLGEPVTIAEHMLQVASAAEQSGENEAIIVAALLHDIGHFTSEFGTFSMDDTEDRHHEDAGARILERFFPTIVTDCVRYHVAAKRYLCAKSPAYFEKLSVASVHSLHLQGGPMNAEEMKAFEANPNLHAIIKVRHLDDGGKIAGLNTPTFAHFAPMVQRVVNAHCESSGL